MDKEQLHEKFNRLLKQVATYTVTPQEIKQFLELVLNVIKNSKDSFDKLSAENLQTIKENIAYIEENHSKQANTLDSKINLATGKFDAKLALLKGIVEKALAQKPKDGENGINGEDGLDGLDGSPDTRIQIVEKINKGKKSDLKIELSQIESFDKIHTKLSDDLINRAIGIVDSRTSFLINKVSNLKTQVDTLEASEGNWGQIGGTLSNQTDLQTALNGKANSLGADDNYVTDAQLVVIGNTSGSNSGDNATNSQYSGLAASKADVGQNFYIGTTLVAINRASAALALTGITSIDGSAATVTGAAQTAITSLGTLTALQVDNLNINGNIISSTDVNGNITLTPNGTGYTILNGNVGIGTTGPNDKLEVNGTIRSTAALSDTINIGQTYGNYNYTGGSGNWGIRTSSVGAFALDTYNANSPINALTVQQNGNVGIGTTGPTSRLHLAAGSATAGTAPLGFTSGTLLTTPVAGKVEFDGTDYYLTI